MYITVIYKGNTKRLMDFSAETLQAKRKLHDMFQVLKEKACSQKIFYPAKLSSRIEKEIENFPDKQKLKEYRTIKPVL